MSVNKIAPEPSSSVVDEEAPPPRRKSVSFNIPNHHQRTTPASTDRYRRIRRSSVTNESSPEEKVFDGEYCGHASLKERVDLLGRSNGIIFQWFSISCVVGLVLYTTLLLFLTKDSTHMKFPLGYMMKWDSKFDPFNDDIAFVKLQIFWTAGVLVPLVIGGVTARFLPSKVLLRDHQRTGSSKTRVRLIWIACLFFLLLSIASQYYVNKTKFMQGDRRRFCMYVYASNVILLSITRFFVGSVDHESNDIVRFGTMFDLQVFLTVANSISAYTMNHVYHMWGDGPPRMHTADDQADYRKSVAMSGMEGFVLFWISTVAAQGLRIVHDIAFTACQSFAPRYFAKVLGILSPQYLYGTKEPFALMGLGMAYTLFVSWMNPNVAWLGMLAVVVQALLFRIRAKLFLPGYTGMPTIIIYRLPRMMYIIAVVNVGFISFFAVPMGRKFSMTCGMLAMIVVACGIVSYSVQYSQTQKRYQRSETKVQIKLDPVLRQYVNTTFHRDLGALLTGSMSRLTQISQDDTNVARNQSIPRVRVTEPSDAYKIEEERVPEWQPEAA